MQANVNCNGKGCHPWPVRVMKCKEGRNHHFYVYELPPVPSCPMAYCAGNSTFQREFFKFLDKPSYYEKGLSLCPSKLVKKQ